MEDILGCLTSGVFTAPIWKAHGKPTKICCTKCGKAIIGGGIVYKDFTVCLLCIEGLLHTYEPYLYPFLYGLQYKTDKEVVQMLPELFQTCGIPVPEELGKQGADSSATTAATPPAVAQFQQVTTNTPMHSKYEIPKFNPTPATASLVQQPAQTSFNAFKPVTVANQTQGASTNTIATGFNTTIPAFNSGFGGGFGQGGFTWKK